MRFTSNARCNFDNKTLTDRYYGASFRWQKQCNVQQWGFFLSNGLLLLSFYKQYHRGCIDNFRRKENPINIEFAAALKLHYSRKILSLCYDFLFAHFIFISIIVSVNLLPHHQNKFQSTVTVFNRIFYEYIRCVKFAWWRVKKQFSKE